VRPLIALAVMLAAIAVLASANGPASAQQSDPDPTSTATPTGTPTMTPTTTPTPTETPTVTPIATPTATATPLATPTPTVTPIPQPSCYDMVPAANTAPVRLRKMFKGTVRAKLADTNLSARISVRGKSRYRHFTLRVKGLVQFHPFGSNNAVQVGKPFNIRFPHHGRTVRSSFSLTQVCLKEVGVYHVKAHLYYRAKGKTIRSGVVIVPLIAFKPITHPVS
jgi:hypothetical protein